MNQLSQELCPNTWIELNEQALAHNIAAFRNLLLTRSPVHLMCVVKANAYGHGLVPIAKAALKHGATWLGVFNVDEGVTLRKANIEAPILVLGPSFGQQYILAEQYNLRITIASLNGIANYLSVVNNPQCAVHLKLETGTNRQGFLFEELSQAAKQLTLAKVNVEGAYTHFADIEDTTEHQFANQQRHQFEQSLATLRQQGLKIPIPHTACTAAAILFPQTYFQMVRVGIGTYGLWPSKETRVSAQNLGRAKLELKPVMTWKTRIAQIKSIDAGQYVGYGRTFRATRKTLVAILPIGYADGYSRQFSNCANVLVNGVRARVIGRVCMNLTMIDVTDVPSAKPNDTVVLLGKWGDEIISADDLASCATTISYEIITRAAPGAPRKFV